MILLPADTHVWLAAGATDMRRGMHGLAALVETTLATNPYLCVELRYVAADREHPADVREIPSLACDVLTDDDT